MEATGERMIPEFHQGQEIYLEHMTRYIFASQFVKNKVVLDIACGSGYGVNHFLKSGASKVIGVDISKETIHYCKNKYLDNESKFLVGSVEQIPVENNSIDVITSFETIEHVIETAQKNFLEEVGRVLRSDGVFVVSTPNSLVYPKGNEFHLKELTIKEFSRLLKSKFKNVSMFYQDDVECSYIYSEENLSGLNKKPELNRRVDKISQKDSMYLVAVCDNIDLKDIKEYVGLSNIKPYLQCINLNEQIDFKNKEIQKKEKEIIIFNQAEKSKRESMEQIEQAIHQKEHEINLMKSSKFWKLRSGYLYFKNGVKFVLLSPKKFIKKYIKLIK